MGTSIGRVIDYLVAGLAGPLTALDPLARVVDNQPNADSESWVVIGRASDEQATVGNAETVYTELGAGRIEESYTLPGYVQVYRSGPSQKPARDAAIVLFDGIVKFVYADPTLGGIITRGRVGVVSRMSLTQTQDDDDTGGGDLRLAAIEFELAIKNSYIP
jgi:hypothetical protein